jgi:hypothetical protein
MLNFTLTITAAPEFLAVLSNFTNAITNAKVVTVPQQAFGDKPVQEQGAAAVNYNQPVQTYASAMPVNQAQQIQNPVPVGTNLVYTQPAAAPVNPVQAPPAGIPTVPTSTQSYTMEQLAVAATQIVDAGRRAELVGLLSSFGVQALTALPKEQYGAFATQLRVLGAKI